MSARGLLGTASSAVTLAALSPMVRRNSDKTIYDFELGTNQYHRDQALYLLLPWPLRHSPVQDAVKARKRRTVLEGLAFLAKSGRRMTMACVMTR